MLFASAIRAKLVIISYLCTDVLKLISNHMIILVINCGSSSIKYQLLDMKSDDVFDVIAFLPVFSSMLPPERTRL